MTGAFEKMKQAAVRALRWSERYTKTDMVYLVKSGFWLNLNFFFVSIFSLLLSIAFANLLSKTEYGTYQYILSIGSILAAFTFSGFNNAITQSVARGYEGTLRASMRPQLLWNLVPAAAAFLWSGYYFWLGNAVLGIGILFVGLSLPLINAFNSYSAFLSGKKAFREQSLYAIVGNAAYYVCIFAGIFLFPSAVPLVFINLFVTTAATIVLYFKAIRAFKPNENNDPEALGYARHLSAMNVIGSVAAQVDSLLVFHFLGAAELALYNIATLLPEKIGGAFKSVMSSALPRLAGRDKEEVHKTLARRTVVMCIVIFAAITAYIFIIPTFFHLAYPAYEDAVRYSQVYVLTVFSIGSSLSVALLTAQRRVKDLYGVNVFLSVIQLVFQFLGIILWGLWGLVGARVLSSFVTFCVTLFLGFQRTK